MVRWGTINREEFGKLSFADTVDEAFKTVRERLEKFGLPVDPVLQAY
jgi:hypothetical protein